MLRASYSTDRGHPIGPLLLHEDPEELRPEKQEPYRPRVLAALSPQTRQHASERPVTFTYKSSSSRAVSLSLTVCSLALEI